MPQPQTRAMFVAALALAAATGGPVKPAARPAISPSAITRRDSALRRVVSALGAGMIAAGRAQLLFQERGAMWAHPPLALKIEGRVKAIAADAAVRAAIGEVAPYDDGERAWLELGANHVTLLWRGEVSRGERQTRALRDGRVVVVDECPAVLSACPERFRDAVEAAAAALDRAGFPTSGLMEIRWLQISPRTHPGATRTFAGYVASIGLKRRRPIWLLGPSKGAAHGR